MSEWYVAYDIKGIQQYISSVPKLRYMVGASALVDKFDREDVPNLARAMALTTNGNNLVIQTGGGKGICICPDHDKAAQLRAKLIAAAHGLGLDIRVGMSVQEHMAWRLMDFLPYIPEISEERRYPCGASGMYPVKGRSPAQRLVHPVVYQRFLAGGTKFDKSAAEECLEPDSSPLPGLDEQYIDSVGNRLLQRMRKESKFTEKLRNPGACIFMRDVTYGSPGAAALGNRRRWAILVMDGNNLGDLHRDLKWRGGQIASDQPPYSLRLSAADVCQHRADISTAIAECVESAVAKAMAQVVTKWFVDYCRAHNNRTAEVMLNDKVVLPFRPLVVGGDDIWILAHPSYALELAMAIAEYFEKESREYNNLWRITQGRLTISGGLLFTPCDFPIAPAIAYAEMLMKNAKDKFRSASRGHEPIEPAPAALDFEVITESLLDSPNERRRRCRLDGSGNLPVLTCRPYTLAELKKTLLPLIKKLQTYNVKGEGRHLLATMQRALFLPLDERRAIAWRIRKHKPELADLLAGNGKTQIAQAAWPEANKTRLLDALILLEEEHRAEQGAGESTEGQP